MGSVLFSPNGRLGSAEFMKAAYILILANFIFGLPDVLGMSSMVSGVASLLGLVTLYCWVVIWIKRYHDAGKTGVYCLLPIAVYILIISTVMLFMLWPYIMQSVEASNGGNPAAAEAIQQNMMQEKGWLIMIIAAVISLAIAFLFNKTIKHEPNENQYGPA